MNKQILYFLFCIFYFVFIQSLISQPSNDEYKNPIILTKLNNWCSSYGQYSNVGATPDVFAKPPCWSSNSSHDVWFSFTAIATALNISIYGEGNNGGNLKYPRLILCQINSNSNLFYNADACNEASFNVGFTSIYTANLKIGITYFIRVDGANDFTGAFKLCINNFTPPILPGQDCISNSFLCDKSSVTQTALNGSGKDSDEGRGTCMDLSIVGLQSENNSAWYTFTIAKSGILAFSIAPNNNLDDIDFALFKMLNGKCNFKRVVRCSAARCFNSTGDIGTTGLNMTSTDTTEGPGCEFGQDNWVKYLNVYAGESYALLINNCSDVNVGTDNGFTLSFDGSCEFAGPIADFDYSQISDCSYLFNDKSQGAMSYHWDFGDGATPDTAITKGPHNVMYSTTGKKTIVLTITGNGGCQVVKVQQIIIYSNTKIPITDTSTCKGISVSINEGNAKAFKWGNGSDANPFIVSPDTTTNYYVTVTDNYGCIGYDTLKVNVKPTPATPIPSFNTPICVGDTLKLLSTNIDNAKYKWEGPNDFVSDLQNPYIQNASIKDEGKYYVRSFVDDCQSDKVDIDVKIFQNPKDFLPNDTILCKAGFRLNLKNIYSEYLWQDNSEKPYYDVANAGIYWVKVTDENNCSAIDTFKVRVACAPVIYIPTAFSPNDDTKNDKLIIYGSDVTKFNIKIFNRWGTLVYKSDNINEEWDGKYNNVTVPQGLYSVIIKYKGVYDINIVEKTRFSTLTILR